MKKRFASVFLLLLSVGISFSQKKPSGFESYEQTIPGSSQRFKMMPIPAGSFTMGSAATERGRNADEGPQKKITLSAFWMSACEVTRDAFDLFYNDQTVSQNNNADAVTRPSAQYVDLTWGMGKEGGYPVNSMSQMAALMYCRWLYTKTGIFYRLPTEAEWEYACRAGSTTTYYFGNDAAQLSKYAWFESNSDNKFHKVGEKLPNAWGLYDMLGNVSEWTLDHYNEKMLEQLTATSDPIAPVVASKYPKVLKGGGYGDDASHLRVAIRIKSDPSWNKRDPQIPKSKWWLTEGAQVGFRIVRPLTQPTPEEANAFYKKYIGK
ncbi:MAG: SUMF1/EgtB/PvdO family nonheme iron enzyme [Bacteroidetes bacterium]|nr:SUMF1/EgtB/PvdO family nonheme iron enzyme [Bacteroidota bacterium]